MTLGRMLFPIFMLMAARSSELGAAIQSQIPLHAHRSTLGSGWECDRGYHRIGDGCAVVQVPANAHIDVYGSGWECIDGYKRQGENCVKMTPEELVADQAAKQALLQRMRQQQVAIETVDWSTCKMHWTGYAVRQGMLPTRRQRQVALKMNMSSADGSLT